MLSLTTRPRVCRDNSAVMGNRELSLRGDIFTIIFDDQGSMVYPYLCFSYIKIVFGNY